MHANASPFITKADGVQEVFSPEKLFQSLLRSGASPDIAEKVTTFIANNLKDGDRTRDIYARAFAQLRRQERAVAARYSIKRALLELGPSGYPFEDFVAEIYKARGYTTQTRVLLEGRCVSHELDMLAKRGEEHIIAEVKYHNNAELRSDIKVALYVRARFDDLFATELEHKHNTVGMIITNTKFTEQAETYARCAGVTLLSWDYPEHGNLREYIEETGVRPLSCLTTLSKAHKHALMEQGIVLTEQVRAREEALVALGLSSSKLQAVFEEVDALSGMRLPVG